MQAPPWGDVMGWDDSKAHFFHDPDKDPQRAIVALRQSGLNAWDKRCCRGINLGRVHGRAAHGTGHANPRHATLFQLGEETAQMFQPKADIDG